MHFFFRTWSKMMHLILLYISSHYQSITSTVCTASLFSLLLWVSRLAGWLLSVDSWHQPALAACSNHRTNQCCMILYDMYGAMHRLMIPISLPYERCQRRATFRFASCTVPISITLRIAWARCLSAPEMEVWNQCDVSKGSTRPRLAALLAPATASESAQRGATHPWRRPLRCRWTAVLAGGWWAAATCQREACCFFDKNLYGAIFLLFYCYQIREDDFVFRCPFCPPYWLALIRADLVQYYFSLVTN